MTKTHLYKTPLFSLAEKFLSSLAAAGFTPATITNRRESIRYFMRFLEKHAITDVKKITPGISQAYARMLYNKKLSHSSIRSRLTTVKKFCEYLCQQNKVLFNPAERIRLPAPEKRLPQDILSINEVKRILIRPDVSTNTGLRNKAILELFYSTGIRRAELRALEIDDVDFISATLMVRHGKGGKERLVPVGERALYWIKKYLIIRKSANEIKKLFVTQCGKEMSLVRLKEIGRSYKKEAGIKRKGACHIFRHSMATHMLEHGASIRHIQEILGHVHLSTTEIYTKVNIRKLHSVYDATFPRLSHAERD